jgi:ketosteroid isomerase-like protein
MELTASSEVTGAMMFSAAPGQTTSAVAMGTTPSAAMRATTDRGTDYCSGGSHNTRDWDATRTPTGAAEGVYHGHDGVRAFWREWLSAWSDLEFEVEDVRAAGTLVVLLIRNQRHWGRHSGIETRTQPYGMVFTFRDGKIVRNCIFPDRESALSAAGLSE